MSDFSQPLAHVQRLMAGRLKAHGIEAAQLEARLILMMVSGLDAAGLIAAGDERLDAGQQAHLAALFKRRLQHEPLARLSGVQEFYGRSFALNADCLIPRADTETLIDAVLPLMKGMPAPQVLDLGTGPGTILLTLLAECPQATGIGVDLAPGALAMAQLNADRLGVARRAAFVCGSWCESVAGSFDVIVANPPYIPKDDLAGLQAEVRLFDPELALDGGADGLEPYRQLMPDFVRLLAPEGVVAVEFGIGQAADVAQLAGRHGFTCRIFCDLGGRERVAVLQNNG